MENKYIENKRVFQHIVEEARNDKDFRGTQIIAYMFGYLTLESSDRELIKELTGYIREVNLYDTLGEVE